MLNCYTLFTYLLYFIKPSIKQLFQKRHETIPSFVIYFQIFSCGPLYRRRCNFVYFKSFYIISYTF